MPDRLEALERLSKLRETGALSTEEFEEEKRRLLASKTEPAIEMQEQRPTRSRTPLYGLSALAIAAVIAVGFWLDRDAMGDRNGSTTSIAPSQKAVPNDNMAVSETGADIRELPEKEQLNRAFTVAFGSNGPVTMRLGDSETEEDVKFTPGHLVWASFGPVLLSEGQVQNAGHVSSGKIAAHYLKPAGASFQVIKRFIPAVETGSMGQVSEWDVSPKFGAYPVVYVEGGGTWQGYTCSVTTLLELAPVKPIELVSIPTYYSDSGALVEGGKTTEIEGKITNIINHQSFDVAYSGSAKFTEHYVRRGNAYVRTGGETRMQTC